MRWANDHDRLDEMRRRTHVVIVAKIDADRALLSVSRANIKRWTEYQGYTPPAVAEWLEILDTYDWPRLRELLLATDQDAVRLRQRTPFVGILTLAERDAIRSAVPPTINARRSAAVSNR